MYFDYYVYMAPALILMLAAQWYVNSAYKKWSKVPNEKRITGMEAAERLVRTAGLHDVSLEQVSGKLSDHYDPRKKVLRLSSGVAQSPSVASLAIALLYNYRGKKLGLIGNFMVSACITIPLIYGGFIYGYSDLNFERLKILFIFDLMIFLSNTGREVNKGIADIEGDRVRGVRTLAVRLGSRTAAIFASVFYLSAVALSFLPWFMSLTSQLYLLLVAIADIGFVTSSFILIHDYSKESALRVKKMVMIWMLIGLLSFLAGVFT